MRNISRKIGKDEKRRDEYTTHAEKRELYRLKKDDEGKLRIADPYEGFLLKLRKPEEDTIAGGAHRIKKREIYINGEKTDLSRIIEGAVKKASRNRK